MRDDPFNGFVGDADASTGGLGLPKNKSGSDRKEAPASQGMLACLTVISTGPF
jgi:hypothetical protein